MVYAYQVRSLMMWPPFPVVQWLSLGDDLLANPQDIERRERASKMAKWYIKRNDKQAGPFETAQLKKLARDEKIKPSDLLRRDDQEAWHKAESFRGLFAERIEQPSSEDISDEPASSQNSSNAPEDSASFSFGASAKAAGLITSKQAELTKIQQVSLPAQYAKLGQKVFESKALKVENEALFGAIQKHCETIAQLTEQSEQQAPGSTITEKAKSLGSKALIATKIKAEELQRRQKLIQLGKTISEKKVIPEDCFSEKAEIERLLSRQDEISLEIESLKATLGKQSRSASKRFGSWKTPAAITAASVILGLLFLYGFKHQNRQDLELVQQNSDLSVESVGQMEGDGGLENIQKAANQMTDATREQASLENRRAIAQVKENKERDEKEKERNKEFLERTKAEQHERDVETALQKKRTQKERLEFIEKCLPNISFDTQNIILSRKLRNSGATVELLGKSIPQFNRLHNKKDWLEFFSFAQNYRYDSSVTPFKWEEYPEQREVYGYLNKFGSNFLLDFTSKEAWAMLIKTKIPLKASNDFEKPGQSLFAIYLPLSLDCKFVWPEEYEQFYEPFKKLEKSFPLKGGPDFRPKRTVVSTNWKKHPDGGYLFHWAPVGLYLIGVSQDTQFVQGGQFRSEADSYHAEEIGGRLRRKTDDLRRKRELGQIDDTVYSKELVAEVISIYEDALVWLEEH